MKGHPVPVKYPLEKHRPPLLRLLWAMPPLVHDIVRVLTRGGRVVNRHPITADGMRAHQLTFEWWDDGLLCYPLRIRALEWTIKRLGVWTRYRDALGVGGGLAIAPERQQILGVPFGRRLRAVWCVLSCCDRAHAIGPPIHKDAP